MLQKGSRVPVKPPFLCHFSKAVSADGVELQACPCGRCQQAKRRAPAAPLKRIQPDVSPRHGALAGRTKPEKHLFWPFFLKERFASGQPSRVPEVTAALKGAGGGWLVAHTVQPVLSLLARFVVHLCCFFNLHFGANANRLHLKMCTFVLKTEETTAQ